MATGEYSLQGILDPAGSRRLLHHSLFTWNRQVLSLFGDNTNIAEVLFLFTLLLIILIHNSLWHTVEQSDAQFGSF